MLPATFAHHYVRNLSEHDISILLLVSLDIIFINLRLIRSEVSFAVTFISLLFICSDLDLNK
jgi:hypothetical protein